jgi:hypothetical protein
MCPQCAPPRCMPRYIAGQQPIRGVSRPVGRVLCARLRGAAVIHLGLPLPTASCGLPASIGRAALDRSRREPLVPLLTLLRVGFTEPPQSPAALVVSYTAVSPLPRVLDAGRSVFCGTVPRVTPGRRYRPPCPVEPGPSSPGLSPARPPGRLTHAQDTPNVTWRRRSQLSKARRAALMSSRPWPASTAARHWRDRAASSGRVAPPASASARSTSLSAHSSGNSGA